MQPFGNYLVLSFIAPSKPQLILEVYRACARANCNVLNSKITTMGNLIAANLYINGNWGSIAKAEASLQKLDKKFDLKLHCERAHETIQHATMMSYTVHITAIDKPGIINGVCEFLLKNAIFFEDIAINTYTVYNQQAKMVHINMKIYLHENLHIASVREKFLNYCDDNNLDVTLEPVKNLT